MKELICIVCPKGCHLHVDDSNGDIKVSGNGCEKGAQYAVAELTHPTRVVTSTVCVNGALHRRCPVKTNGAIPKEKIFDAMATLNGITLEAPVKLGQVVVENVCGTGLDFVTARTMEAVK